MAQKTDDRGARQDFDWSACPGTLCIFTRALDLKLRLTELVQLYAIPFYEKCGYQSEGEPFYGDGGKRRRHGEESPSADPLRDVAMHQNMVAEITRG